MHARKRLFFVMYRSPQVRAQGGTKLLLEKFSSPQEKCVGRILKLSDIVLKNCPSPRKLFAPPGVQSWLRAWKSSKRLVFLFPCWDIIKCLNASVLTTAVFELVQQFFHATEIGNVANALSVCADHPQQTKERQLFRIKWTIAEHNLKHA